MDAPRQLSSFRSVHKVYRTARKHAHYKLPKLLNEDSNGSKPRDVRISSTSFAVGMLKYLVLPIVACLHAKHHGGMSQQSVVVILKIVGFTAIAVFPLLIWLLPSEADGGIWPNLSATEASVALLMTALALAFDSVGAAQFCDLLESKSINPIHATKGPSPLSKKERKLLEQHGLHHTPRLRQAWMNGFGAVRRHQRWCHKCCCRRCCRTADSVQYTPIRQDVDMDLAERAFVMLRALPSAFHRLLELDSFQSPQRYGGPASSAHALDMLLSPVRAKTSLVMEALMAFCAASTSLAMPTFLAATRAVTLAADSQPICGALESITGRTVEASICILGAFQLAAISSVGFGVLAAVLVALRRKTNACIFAGMLIMRFCAVVSALMLLIFVALNITSTTQGTVVLLLIYFITFVSLSTVWNWVIHALQTIQWLYAAVVELQGALLADVVMEGPSGMTRRRSRVADAGKEQVAAARPGGNTTKVLQRRKAKRRILTDFVNMLRWMYRVGGLTVPGTTTARVEEVDSEHHLLLELDPREPAHLRVLIAARQAVEIVGGAMLEGAFSAILVGSTVVAGAMFAAMLLRLLMPNLMGDVTRALHFTTAAAVLAWAAMSLVIIIISAAVKTDGAHKQYTATLASLQADAAFWIADTTGEAEPPHAATSGDVTAVGGGAWTGSAGGGPGVGAGAGAGATAATGTGTVGGGAAGTTQVRAEPSSAEVKESAVMQQATPIAFVDQEHAGTFGLHGLKLKAHPHGVSAGRVEWEVEVGPGPWAVAVATVEARFQLSVEEVIVSGVRRPDEPCHSLYAEGGAFTTNDPMGGAKTRTLLVKLDAADQHGNASASITVDGRVQSADLSMLDRWFDSMYLLLSGDVQAVRLSKGHYNLQGFQHLSDGASAAAPVTVQEAEYKDVACNGWFLRWKRDRASHGEMAALVFSEPDVNANVVAVMDGCTAGYVVHGVFVDQFDTQWLKVKLAEGQDGGEGSPTAAAAEPSSRQVVPAFSAAVQIEDAASANGTHAQVAPAGQSLAQSKPDSTDQSGDFGWVAAQALRLRGFMDPLPRHTVQAAIASVQAGTKPPPLATQRTQAWRLLTAALQDTALSPMTIQMFGIALDAKLRAALISATITIVSLLVNQFASGN